MKPWTGLPLAVVFAFAADAGAQLHKCKDKSGRSVYQDTPCEDGTAVASVRAPTGGPVHSGNAAERGTWESTIVFPPGGKSLTQEELDATGMYAFFLGRPMKTVSCSEPPMQHIFLDGSCKNVVATRGGTCKREELTDETGGTKLKVVQTITGDFRSSYRVDQIFTRTHASEPTPAVQQSSAEFRYLGPCKPGMRGQAPLFVKDNGDWVTEAQMKEELERRRRK